MATVNSIESNWQESADQQAETSEWLESFEDILAAEGPERGKQLLHTLNDCARNHGIRVGGALDSPYINTISVDDQPEYPGDLALERKITTIIRWNALAMVVRANSDDGEVGGHLASYASAADLFEVGFNHFFHGPGDRSDRDRQDDLLFVQPHSAPGIYARAFLEGRLSEGQLANYRREVDGGGLSSYPHPYLMKEFWQFPTGSMGLGVIAAVYQARFMRYLQHRDLVSPSQRRVWAFIGDGEMDEPESVAGLTLAARESLDNLTFVVNCNLQRLDGPVRGNGSIIRELERLFVGAGWNVIKLLWGSEWDDLFERDLTNALIRRFEKTVDGELQRYGAYGGAYNREHFFNESPELKQIVADLSDEQIDSLRRGGHDPVKIYAAFHSAVHHKGQPTVILAQTKKGFGMGQWGESRMSSHQQKKLEAEALLYFRDRFELPLSDAEAESAAFFRPAADSPEITYLLERRQRLGGFTPSRVSRITAGIDLASETSPISIPQGPRELSTTTAFVRLLTSLLKEPAFAQRVVPIVADEARTFGMQSLFRRVGIYSSCGQLYQPQDSGELLAYKESRDGAILEEGINEAGAMSSWIAAATSYAHHGFAALPFYIFYSIFGFQRVGDLIWAAADSGARGFLIGATAGRTTLAGEGLQHQDGSSHLLASTIPTCRAYDPCFDYEVAVILKHGIHALFEAEENLIFYITVMNEKYSHPELPAGAEEGIVRGMYRFRQGDPGKRVRVQLLGSGTILREVIAAADLLEREWSVAADIWSVTSFTELRREAMETERVLRLRLDKGSKSSLPHSWIEQCLSSGPGPVIAATDYVRAVPDLIRGWIRAKYITLGTDGFGRSDSRAKLRRFFEVDRTSIAFAALSALADEGSIGETQLRKFKERHGYTPSRRAPWND